MLNINRLLARQVRAMIRRALNIHPRAYDRTAVRLSGTATGLTIRCATDNAAVEIHDATPQSEEALIVPFTLFDDCAGKRPDPVTLERDQDRQIAAQWREGQVPQILRYDLLEATAEFPQVPSHLAENPPELLVTSTPATRPCRALMKFSRCVCEMSAPTTVCWDVPSARCVVV